MVVISKRTKGHIAKVGISSGKASEAQTLTFELEDSEARNLLRAVITTRRGIIAFLECFSLTGNNRKDQLKMLKKNWRNIITISGRVGEDHEQLHDKPDGEDELEALSNHFNYFGGDEIWDLIRNTGFHELLPIS